MNSIILFRKHYRNGRRENVKCEETEPTTAVGLQERSGRPSEDSPRQCAVVHGLHVDAQPSNCHPVVRGL